MSADIEISADTTQAVSAVGALGAALDELGRKSLSDKAFKAYTNQVERDIGRLAAKMVNVNREIATEQSKFSQFAQGNIGSSGNRFGVGLTQGMQSVRRETDAYNRSLQQTLNYQDRLTAASRGQGGGDFRQNTAGKWINSQGRFLSSADLANADALTGQYEKLIGLRKQDRQIGVQTQAGMMLEANLASKFVDSQSELVRIRQRGAQQAMLEGVFAQKLYGIADPMATRMQRVANVMRQIPPATWGQQISRVTSSIAGMSNSTRYAMYDVSASAGVAGVAILGLGIAATGAAIAHERAFANVTRTTQTSTAGYAVLNRQLELMAMTLPVTYEELTNIATAAGQLGISASGVASFTRTVAMLTATTNLTSDAAGVALARFRTFFAVTEGENPALAVTDSTMSNLASSILKVGVNSIATETGIVNVATQIASMADYAGYTANQVIGLAGALSSIGVAPELSRGTITRTFSLIGNAVSTNGVQLEKFAKLAGVSAEQFRKAWGTEDFADVFTGMMKGISEFGGDANMMLMELGFNSVRDRPLLLRLAGAADEAGVSGGLLAQTMADAYAGWIQNSELALQYSKISQTTSARIQVLAQSFEQLFATMGKQTGGFAGEAATQLTNFVKGIEAMAGSDVGQVFGSVAVQAAIAVGGLLLMVSAGARAVASIQGVGVAWTAMTNTALGSMSRISMGLKVLSLTGGIVTMVAALAGIIVGFAAMEKGAADARRAMQDFDGLAAAMAQDAEAGETNLRGIVNASNDTAESASQARAQATRMAKALYGAGDAADAGRASLDKLSSSATASSYAYGAAADAVYNSALMQSEGFQKLFDMDTNRGFLGLSGNFRYLDFKGVKAELFDWDAIKEESLREGGNTFKLVQSQMREMLGEQGFAEVMSTDEGQKEFLRYAREVADVVPGISSELKTAQLNADILKNKSNDAFKKMSEGAISATEALGSMDEATQKAVDAYAGGLTKFVDVKGLIGLTQQLEESQKKGLSAEEAKQAAADYEKAWVNAYGGAQFSLNSYLQTFQRAAGEQAKFTENLQVLATNGLDSSIISDLAAMGPEANRLVQALVDDVNATGGAGLAKFGDLWGKTGYDAMVAFAVQAKLGQVVIDNVMRTGGIEALRAFNAALASGEGTDAALASIQHDLNGVKLKTTAPIVPNPKNLTWAQKKLWEEQNRLNATARVTVLPIAGGSAITVRASDGGKRVVLHPFAEGGHVTGPGTGTSDSIPARLSHGEFVMTAKATRAIGVGNLYAMMHQAQGSRKAPKGRGYANGGYVGSGGSNGSPTVVLAHLAPEDRALLRSLQPIVRIGDRDISNANRAADRASSRRGV